MYSRLEQTHAYLNEHVCQAKGFACNDVPPVSDNRKPATPSVTLIFFFSLRVCVLCVLGLCEKILSVSASVSLSLGISNRVRLLYPHQPEYCTLINLLVSQTTVLWSQDYCQAAPPSVTFVCLFTFVYAYGFVDWFCVFLSWEWCKAATPNVSIVCLLNFVHTYVIVHCFVYFWVWYACVLCVSVFFVDIGYFSKWAYPQTRYISKWAYPQIDYVSKWACPQIDYISEWAYPQIDYVSEWAYPQIDYVSKWAYPQNQTILRLPPQVLHLYLCVLCIYVDFVCL
jgi:hypothetical protein